MRLPNFKVDRFEARTTDFLASAWVFHEFPVSLPIEMEPEDSQGIESVSVLLVDIVELTFSFWIVQEAPGCFVIFIGVSLSRFLHVLRIANGLFERKMNQTLSWVRQQLKAELCGSKIESQGSPNCFW